MEVGCESPYEQVTVMPVGFLIAMGQVRHMERMDWVAFPTRAAV